MEGTQLDEIDNNANFLMQSSDQLYKYFQKN